MDQETDKRSAKVECVLAFDRNAVGYDRWYSEETGSLILKSEVKAVEALVPKGLGTEVGVGTGVFSSSLGVSLGIDPAPNMLRLSKKKGVATICGTVEFLPIRSECLDYVLLVFTICFLQDPIVSLKEIRRVIRKGGSLVLSFIPKGSSWADLYEMKKSEGHPIYRHARFYNYEEVRAMLHNSEFEITEGRVTLRQHPLRVTKVEEPTDLVEPSSQYGLVVLSCKRIIE